MSNFNTINLDIDERGVATLELNRPQKHNALNAEMIIELTAAAKKLGADPTVRAVILAASGKTFCAGGDLEWMRAQIDKSRAEKMIESRSLATLLAALNNLPKPLIGRVQGPSYGGGIGLMAVCDIVIAAENARFALTETKLGLIPATIGPFVVRRMGEGLARQVYFTAKTFDTEFALRAGLVSKACNQEDLDVCVQEEIEAAFKCAPGAVAAAKAQCLALGGEDLDSSGAKSAELLADRWETDEAQHGISAFFAKQAPRWAK